MLGQVCGKTDPGSLRDLKKVARYFLGTKHMALHLFRQTFPSSISTDVDSDFAGCRSNRRSTTGMVQMVAEHAVKHTSNLQGATGLNVSECEKNALTHGAAHGLGVKAYMADLEFELSLQIFSESSAAKAFAVRRGLGRQRHVQTRHLWLQERVAATHLTVQKFWNNTEPSRHSHKGSQQRKTGETQKEDWTQTCRSTQQLEGAQTLEQSSQAMCGEPADMSRRSAGEFMRHWYCRGRWNNWNLQDDGNANVNSVDEQVISVECTSQTRCRARQWTSTCTLLESIRWDRLRDC